MPALRNIYRGFIWGLLAVQGVMWFGIPGLLTYRYQQVLALQILSGIAAFAAVLGLVNLIRGFRLFPRLGAVWNRLIHAGLSVVSGYIFYEATSGWILLDLCP